MKTSFRKTLHRTRTLRLLSVLPLVCALILAAAGEQARAAHPVKLALIIAETGIAAKEEIPAIQAARLAVEEINASGGLLGHPVTLVVIDNKSTPLGAKKAAEEAVKQGVIGVVGAFRSSHSLAMVPVVQKAGVPMITPPATNPDVTAGSDYVFRACFIDSFQGRVMAELAYRDLGLKTAVALTNITENYSITLTRFFREHFERVGGTFLWEGSYPGTATDFRDILGRVKDLHPDAVFIPGYARDSGLIISQARAMGIDPVFLGGDAWDQGIVEYAGRALEGSYYSSHWHHDVPFAANEHLKKAFRRKFGNAQIDNMRIPLTYDAVMLFADAARRSASLAPRDIRAALAQTKDFKGATGSITFDRDGNPVGKEASIMRFNDGAWRYYKSFSSP
ncbi:MAG TPA: ABC transporter substrate-binding protein [Deltaproteobacteria bacterium]|nr:ABC transporter substrate-binding protein [Deltaproteobacteria bacterium]